MHSKLLKKKISFISKALFSVLLITTFFAPLQGLFVSQAKAQSPSNAKATSDANNPNISPTASGATASGQGGTVRTSAAGGGTDVITSSCWSDWGTCLSSVVYVFTVGLMSIFAYIGAFIFDTAVQITLQSVTYSQYFLTQSWAAVRDLANMIFIFLLVYLAVTVILQAETQGTMKMLAGIIIAALLINFSFFFTRLVIDGGNILATQFYNAIPAPTLNSSGATGTGTMGAVQAAASSFSSNGNVKDLTRGIMDVVGVQSILGPGSFARFSQQGANEFTKLITLSFVYIAVAAILAMLAFTFIAVGVKFLVRIVVLWLAIIASPLAFVFGAMYKKGSADRFNVLSRWGKALIEYAFYPAVFLFIFWVINFFATQLASNGTSSILANALNDAGSAATTGQLFTIASAVAGVSVRLGIIVALIYMAMRVSDSFAKTGYKAIDSLGGRAGGLVAAGLAVTGAAVGRNTLGKGAYNFSQSTMGRKLGTNVLTRPILSGAQKLGKASYDARGIPGAQSVTKKLMGIDIGKPTNTNYPKLVEARAKAKKEYSETLKPSQKVLNASFERAVRNLNDEDRQKLVDAANNYADIQDKRAVGEATNEDVKRAARELKAITDKTGVIKTGKSLAGNDLNKEYADNLIKGWFVSGADKEAYTQIKSVKNDAERLKAALTKMGYKPTPETPETTATTTQTQNTQTRVASTVSGDSNQTNTGPQPEISSESDVTGHRRQGGLYVPHIPGRNTISDADRAERQGRSSQTASVDLQVVENRIAGATTGGSPGGSVPGRGPLGPLPTSSPFDESYYGGVSSQELTDQTRALNTSTNEQASRVISAIENLESSLASSTQTQQREASRASGELQAGVRNVAEEVRRLRNTTSTESASLRESLLSRPAFSLNEQLNNSLSPEQRRAVQPTNGEPIRAIPRTNSMSPITTNYQQTTQPQDNQRETPPIPPQNNQHN